MTTVDCTALDAIETALETIRSIDADVSPAVPACLEGLQRLAESITSPVRVAVFGEYNSGKTSVANAVLGTSVLPTSPISNTQVPIVARYGDTPRVEAVTDTMRYDIDPSAPLDIPESGRLRQIVVSIPLDLLHQMEIMDTPSNADLAAAVETASIFVWCTVATRAWGETERRRWTDLPARCRRWGILAATHCDVLEDAERIKRVRSRLETEAGDLFSAIAMVDAHSDDDTHESIDAGQGSRAIDNLADLIETAVARFRSRRSRPAARIASRIARLTLHNLDPGWDGGSGIPIWEEAAQRLRRALSARPRGDALRHELSTARALDTIERFEVEAGPAFPEFRELGAALLRPAKVNASCRAAEVALDDMAAILYLVTQDTPRGFGKDGQPERLAVCRALLPLILLGDR